MTRLQKAILEVLKRSHNHLSAKEIYAMVQADFPTVAMGTVYRNLNQFAEEKLIRRVSGLGSADLFEGNLLPHSHSQCLSCGKVEDVHIPGMREFIQEQIGDETVSLDLLVNVICSDCMKKDSNFLKGTRDDR